MRQVKLHCAEPLDEKLQPHLQNSDQFAWVNLESCDFVLHPDVLWSTGKTTKQLQEISQKHAYQNKKVLVFIVDDYEKRYPYLSNLILFRTSLKRSLRRRNEYLLPYIWECSQQVMVAQTDSKGPVVGFCGMNNSYRKKSIAAFEKHPKIRSCFVVRDKFWGGAPHDQQVIAEYEENMKASHYMLCDRGKGNFSMRFYQTLAFGRIPVLVNSDMLLPFADQIDWTRYAIIERNSNRCVQRVLSTYESGDYLQMQQNCRELYEQYFSEKKSIYRLICAVNEEDLKPIRKFWFQSGW